MAKISSKGTSARENLTMEKCRKAEPIQRPDGTYQQRIYFDTKYQGLALVVGARTKTWVAVGDLKGRQKRIKLGTFPMMDREQVKGLCAQALVKLREGVDPVAERREAQLRQQSLKEAADKYLANPTHIKTGRKLSPATLRYYRTGLTQLAPLHDRELHTITEEDVIDLRKAIGKPSMSNCALTFLRLIWNHTFRRTRPNPVYHAMYRLERKHKLTLPQLPAFWQNVSALTNTVHRDALRFLVFTGARKGSTLRLAWSDVDFERRSIYFKHVKGDRPFSFPMSDELYKLLQARRAENQKFGAGQWVFPGDTKAGHIGEGTLNGITLSGVEWRPHELRNWFVTAAKRSGIFPDQVKLLVNHKLGKDVTDGYAVTEFLAEDLAKPLRRVTDVLRQLYGMDETHETVSLTEAM